MQLFNMGDFTLNSGVKSGFKIDCDALSDKDLEVIAKMISNSMPLFGAVFGIPTGGLRLARALKTYISPGEESLLIVDDVCTTGGSLEKYKILSRLSFKKIMGVVIFNRGNCPDWVVPIFTMNEKVTL